MLKHGVLDADANPDKAAVIIDMLWTTTGHPCPQVNPPSHTKSPRVPSLSKAVEMYRMRPKRDCGARDDLGEAQV